MSIEEKEMLDNAGAIILKYKNVPGGMEVIRETMNNLYKYFKGVIPEATFSDKRLLEIFKLERLLEDKFLPLESEPIFDQNNPVVFPEVIETEEDCEMAVSYIVYKTREQLNDKHNIKSATLDKMCVTSSMIVEEVCDSLGVKHTDFSCDNDLSRGLFHCFNVVSFDLPNGEVKMYLVDCTYRQFFTYDECFTERIGIPLNEGANIGSFMMMDEARKRTAEGLLTKGYMEFNPQNIKDYFDGFVYSGRNGLFYEELDKPTIGKSDYEPSYTYMDYLDALKSGGLKHEPFIGRQFSVLKHPVTFGSALDDVKSNKNVY